MPRIIISDEMIQMNYILTLFPYIIIILYSIYDIHCTYVTGSLSRKREKRGS